MNTALSLAGILIFIFGVLFVITRISMKKIQDVANHKNIITLTDKNFQLQLKNKIVLVDFWAGWCVPCKMMAPILNEVAAELNGSSLVGKVNVEQYQSLARKFGVRSIPTMILFKNGKEIDRVVGVKNKEYILRQIKKA